jgi:rSAM/selenodomain-associated transferase 2
MGSFTAGMLAPALISVIVPIRDEPPGAAGAFARFASPPESELLVADGGADRQAREAFRAAGARVITSPGSRGARLAAAAASARGEVLFFLHADSRPPQEALALIRQSLDGGAEAGASSLAYEGADLAMRWIAWWANRRSRLGRMPFGDQGIFCRRAAYERAGGFRDLPICDDVDLVRRLRRAGRFVVRREKTVTSPRRYREVGALRQVLRTWRVLIGYYAGASPEALTRWYEGRGRS